MVLDGEGEAAKYQNGHATGVKLRSYTNFKRPQYFNARRGTGRDLLFWDASRVTGILRTLQGMDRSVAPSAVT